KGSGASLTASARNSDFYGRATHRNAFPRSLSFTLDQDLAKTGTFGGSSDSLKAGATFTAIVKGTVGDIISGSFFSFNGPGTGYNQPDGFGVVDAVKSVEAILQNPATSPSTPLANNPPAR